LSAQCYTERNWRRGNVCMRYGLLTVCDLWVLWPVDCISHLLLALYGLWAVGNMGQSAESYMAVWTEWPFNHLYRLYGIWAVSFIDCVGRTGYLFF
jgi:hypothetical protein